MNLLDIENFSFNNRLEEVEVHSTPELINEKYLKGEIRIVTEQARYPLDTITTMLKEGKYNLNPDYQRRKRWDLEKKSKLIESFIINVPIPPIFLYEFQYSKYEVMDGLQRLTTIDDFYQNKFELTGLEMWPELNGYKYQYLPERVREGIDRRYLSSIVLLNETAKDDETAARLKQLVFSRLNTGGEKLVPQELRNAKFGGDFNDLCIELSFNNDFRALYNYTIAEMSEGNLINEPALLEDNAYRNMTDVELVLRFFAYRHLDQLGGTQELFLDRYLEYANKYLDETRMYLKGIFEQTISLVYEIFGEEAFYMPIRERQTKTPTKTIYDPLMQAVSKKLDTRDALIRNKEDILREKYSTPYDDRLFNGKLTGKEDVKRRIEYFDQLLDKYII